LRATNSLNNNNNNPMTFIDELDPYALKTAQQTKMNFLHQGLLTGAEYMCPDLLKNIIVILVMD